MKFLFDIPEPIPHRHGSYVKENREEEGENLAADCLISPLREGIGRAKSVDADKYAEAYEDIRKKMAAEIADITAGGEEQ